jgi:hypothetical protein
LPDLSKWISEKFLHCGADHLGNYLALSVVEVEETVLMCFLVVEDTWSLNFQTHHRLGFCGYDGSGTYYDHHVSEKI